ncbi:XAC0095 family protein [Lysobacter enzymogenes]|uniref:XAC0095 family protein n=1 Tax=Lysobacter enzymogenes TaxID=69 RepID=UPI003D2F8A47
MGNRKRSVLRFDCYILPLGAHQALIQARDHLHLLAQLAQPQGEDSPDVVYLSAEALAHCFDRLADDLDRIVHAAAPYGP